MHMRLEGTTFVSCLAVAVVGSEWGRDSEKACMTWARLAVLRQEAEKRVDLVRKGHGK